MSQSLFEQLMLGELYYKVSLDSTVNLNAVPQGMALRTIGIGSQCELVPFPSLGIQGTWDMLADSNVPSGGGAGSIYQITGGTAVRSGETYEDDDLAIILSDSTTSRNLTTFNVNVTPGSVNFISGNWDISAAANNTVPMGATDGSVYRITPGTYPHTHTSGLGAFVEVYNEDDLAIVVDATVPIVRNMSFYANLTGITSVVKGTWDMNTLGGVLPLGTAQYDIYRVTGLDYTLSGQLYRADDLAFVLDTVGPIVKNLTIGLIQDGVVATDSTWSSDKIVDYLENDFIDDGVVAVDSTWSSDKISTELALKATLDDGVVSLLATWSSDKIKDYADTHITDTTVHFLINDAASTIDTVWSSQKLTAMFGAVSAIINDAAGLGDTTETWSADRIVTVLYNPFITHAGDATIHRSINDAGTSATDLWSADKIIDYINNFGGLFIDDLAGNGDLDVTWSADRLYNFVEIGHIGDATLHRTINDVGTGITDLWSAAQIISYVGANGGDSIDDGVVSLLTTWSSDKINDEIQNHATDLSIHRSINDAGIAVTDLWSADKIISYVASNSGVTINDLTTSLLTTWSSSKVSAFVGTSVAALINDLSTSNSTTWSSNKISTFVAAAVAAVDLTPIIDDGVTVLDQTWSSTKINARIYNDFRSDIIRDDLLSSNNSTWSIDKITTEIGLGGGGGGGGLTPWVVLTGATTLVDKGRYLLDYSGGMFDVTLPASPTFGKEVVLFHTEGDVEAEPVPPRVLRNSSNIEGTAADLDLDINGAYTVLVYSGDVTIGWKVA
jgi:hypothetical protein